MPEQAIYLIAKLPLEDDEDFSKKMINIKIAVKHSVLALAETVLGKVPLIIPPGDEFLISILRTECKKAKIKFADWFRIGIPVWEHEHRNNYDITHVVVVGGDKTTLAEVEQLISVFPQTKIVVAPHTGDVAYNIAERFDLPRDVKLWQSNENRAFKQILGLGNEPVRPKTHKRKLRGSELNWRRSNHGFLLDAENTPVLGVRVEDAEISAICFETEDTVFKGDLLEFVAFLPKLQFVRRGAVWRRV